MLNAEKKESCRSIGRTINSAVFTTPITPTESICAANAIELSSVELSKRVFSVFLLLIILLLIRLVRVLLLSSAIPKISVKETKEVDL